MKCIPRKLHAVIALVLILTLLAYPWLFLERPYGTETVALFFTGIAKLWYSILSKYELGLDKFMNFKNHLSFDFLMGLGLLTAPWIWGFGYRALWPHIIIGTILIILAVFSKNNSIKVSKTEEIISF